MHAATAIDPLDSDKRTWMGGARPRVYSWSPTTA
jgi:hypothetical protein